jgi:abequosyltransferase
MRPPETNQGMNTTYDISFCIPSFNFGRFIGETLDSIIREADERVQIVIVDGGSSDNTAQVVAEKSRTFPHIKFIQRSERSSVDRDILESVVQADGEFCWLFSSDDLLAPGAVAFVRAQLTDDWDVFLTNFAVCDFHMRRRFRHRILDVRALSTFDWSNPSDRTRYFTLAQTTTAFFSFISALVVRRASWLSVPQQTEFIGSCWIIAAQLFALARKKLVVRYYPGELLFKRGDNDSFLSAGLVNRVALSVTGFRNVAAHYFGTGSPEARHVRRVVRNEYTLRTMLRYKVEIANLKNVGQLERFVALFKQHFSSGALFDVLRRNTVHAPTTILRALLWIHYRFKSAREIASER